MEEGKTEGRNTGKMVWIVLVSVGILMTIFPIDDYFSRFAVYLQEPLADIASWILNGIGLGNIRTDCSGIMMTDNLFSINVAPECAGIRSISALIVLSAVYSWMEKMNVPGGIVLMLLTVPIAVVGNIIRISTVCIVGVCCGKDFAMGFFHDCSGYFVFMVNIVIMIVCAKVVSRLFGKRNG
jgi:exosortase